MIEQGQLIGLAERLIEVDGAVAVVLGGSRARGTATENSDVDLGLFYRFPLDVAALGRLAREISGPQAAVTQPGAWGPWVDGGGWLSIAGTAVDWIYRDLDRVQASWRDAQAGRYTFHAQAGHPLGVPDFAYAGEAAVCVVLADPTGEVTSLHEAARHYPPRLADALVAGLWEADFLLGGARKVVERGDAAYVTGCLFRVLGVCAHALHGRAGVWLTNEKGAIAATGALPIAPADFAARAQALLGSIGTTPAELRATLVIAAGLVNEVAVAVRPASDGTPDSS